MGDTQEAFLFPHTHTHRVQAREKDHIPLCGRQPTIQDLTLLPIHF